ncbi:STAS domain-containing protein [Streptomyces griseorubiginosus]|uniref:STAS domain-containing protein n=1 Tax=Streptomyces griseorubiginosus TaxID=67304 RepID=UPI00369D479F
MTEPDLTVDQQIHEAGPVLLKVTGELDHHTAPRLTQALEDIHLSPGTALVVDLCDLTYCDSTGITVLVTAYQRAEAAGSSFSLAGLGRDLTRMFQTVGLDQVFALHPTTEAAVAAVRH